MEDKIKEMLRKHEMWVNGEGGERADFSYENLIGANLIGANLTGANLFRATLYGANLTGANLFRATLYGANLEGANLKGANLDGAELSEANLDEIIIDGFTRGLPQVSFTQEEFINLNENEAGTAKEEIIQDVELSSSKDNQNLYKYPSKAESISSALNALVNIVESDLRKAFEAGYAKAIDDSVSEISKLKIELIELKNEMNKLDGRNTQ